MCRSSSFDAQDVPLPCWNVVSVTMISRVDAQKKYHSGCEAYACLELLAIRIVVSLMWTKTERDGGKN